MMFVLGSWYIFQWQHELGIYAWHAVEAHGYIAIFVLLFLSGVGLPLPEDVPLIAAGVAIARRGMIWSIAGPVAWVAMMLGDSALYIFGYVLGRKVIHLPIIGKHVSEIRLKRCERWFDQWGIWAVGIGRMFAGIRTAIVVTAGTMRFHYLKLLMADGVAAVISGGAFMVLGYFAAQHAASVSERVLEFAEPYSNLLKLVAIGACLALIIVLWARARARRAAMAPAGKVDQVAHPIEPT
jgi:membrane protein DedA with SNARE-associated domain